MNCGFFDRFRTENRTGDCVKVQIDYGPRAAVFMPGTAICTKVTL